jgi:hypothetical protein
MYALNRQRETQRRSNRFDCLLEAVRVILNNCGTIGDKINDSFEHFRISTVEHDSIVPPRINLVEAGLAPVPKQKKTSTKDWTDAQKDSELIRMFNQSIGEATGSPYDFAAQKNTTTITIQWKHISSALDDYADVRKTDWRERAAALVKGTKIKIQIKGS